MANVFLKECEVKETNHYQALDENVWNWLDISTKLSLHKKKDVVFLYYKASDEKFYKIGKLSEEDADPIDKFLDATQTTKDVANIQKNIGETDKLFECKISKFNKEADEDKRLSVAIFIKKEK